MCIVTGTSREKLTKNKPERRSPKMAARKDDVIPPQDKSDVNDTKPRSQRSQRKNYKEDLESDDDKSWSGESVSETDDDASVVVIGEERKYAKPNRNSVSEYFMYFQNPFNFMFSTRPHSLML